MKKKVLQQLLLNVTNAAIASSNITGYIKATENKSEKDISGILSKKMFNAGPFESIDDLNKVNGIGPKTIFNMAISVFSKGASLKNTATLNPQFIADFLETS